MTIEQIISIENMPEYQNKLDQEIIERALLWKILQSSASGSNKNLKGQIISTEFKNNVSKL